MKNADINETIAFINSGYVLFPPMNARQRARFNQKFGLGTGFIVAGGELRYNPNPNINLPIARPLQVQNVLRNIYALDNEGLGKGLETFYKSVSSQYLNIQKTLTDAFLQNSKCSYCDFCSKRTMGH